jgi:hypothetical protein
MVKQFDPEKHDKPSPAEIEKAKAANGGQVPKGEKPSAAQKPGGKPGQKQAGKPTTKPTTTGGGGGSSSLKAAPQQKIDKLNPALAQQKAAINKSVSQAATEKPPTKIPAVDFKTDAEKSKEKQKEIPNDKQSSVAADKTKLKQLMPGMDTSKKSVNDVPPEARKEAVTAIDKISQDLIKAKETGGKAENTNLCKVTVPGTNLYCDGNKNIPRDQMPQFRGKPEPGSEADKMPRDKNGEVETSHIFDKMLEKEGIKISEPTAVPADSLKATQSELVGPKVVGMMGVLDKDCNNKKCDEKDQQDYKNITDPIYVSNDGYVVDGHHRWAAIVSHNIKNPDRQIPMNVRVIDDKIDSVIPKANKFAQDIGIAAKSGKEGTKGGPPAAQSKPIAEKTYLKLSSFLK